MYLGPILSIKKRYFYSRGIPSDCLVVSISVHSMTTFSAYDLSIDLKLCVEGALVAFSGVVRAQKSFYSDSTEDFLKSQDILAEAEGPHQIALDAWCEMSKTTQKSISSEMDVLKKSAKTLMSYLDKRHLMTREGLMERIYAVVMDMGKLVNAFSTKSNKYTEYVGDVTNSMLTGVLARKPDLLDEWLRGNSPLNPSNSCSNLP